MMQLQQAWQWVHQRMPEARLVGADARTALELLRVHTDTRSLQEGDLFVALKGEAFDANSMLAQVRAQGARAAIAHGGLEAAGLAGIEVRDTRLALGALAAGWRAQFALPLVAVTGSNGKTTVTQMLAAIFEAFAPAQVLATQGNLNNDIGLPQTLLRLRASDSIGVVELGMNHPGEIAYLADLARPTVALVNNAQREHLEFMHTVEAVAAENGAVLSALPEAGVAVFPADDLYSASWKALAGSRRCLSFGAGGAVSLVAAQWCDNGWTLQAQTPLGALQGRLRIAGEHNLRNALAAAASAIAAGVPLGAIAQGWADFVPVAGRSRALSLQHAGRSITLVDDSYNANPDSVRAAIDVLAALPAPRLLVLGDMAEVGDQGPAFHAEAGSYAKACGIELLLALGPQSLHAVRSFGAGGQHYPDRAALTAALTAALPQLGSVLVKGSRFMQMERVLASIGALQQKHAPEEDAMPAQSLSPTGGQAC